MSREHYEKFFKQADTDGSGSLDFNELITVLKKNGYCGQSDDEIKAMFQAVDTSGDDKISYQEYMVAMGEQPPDTHGRAAMRQCFNEFDKNGDGTIDRKELKLVFQELQQNLPEKQLTRIMELADTDSSGSLNIEEFIAFVFGK